MTRDELIRNLKYTMEKHKNDTVDTFGTNISLMCKDILDYLEQEPKTEHWIPTSESYPKDCEEVLITLGKTVYKAPTVSHRGCWFVHGDHNMFCASKEDVSAWMPLPELFKEGEE